MKKVRIVIALLLTGWLPLLHAAEAEPAPATEPAQESPTNDSAQQAEQQAGTEPVQGPADDLLEEDEERSTTPRFIPTEQLSQDLGVSFPADI